MTLPEATEALGGFKGHGPDQGRLVSPTQCPAGNGPPEDGGLAETTKKLLRRFVCLRGQSEISGSPDPRIHRRISQKTTNKR